MSDDSSSDSGEDTFLVSKMEKGKLRHKCRHPGCDKFFSRPSRLENHERIHTGERPFKCNLCEKDYARKEHLKRHLVVSHSPENTDKLPAERLPCKDCTLTFANKYSLAKHRKKFHIGKDYVCDICTKAFSKHNLLERHRGEHFSILPHACTKCGKTFRFPNKLRLHEATHSKKYECKICGVNDFSTWSEMMKHKKRVHTSNDNREFKCRECKKAFSSQKVLDQHMVTHGSERFVWHCPFEECPRFYCYEKNLSQHIRTYHDEQRLKCSHCPKTFVTNAKLKYHLERFHSNKPSPSRKFPEKRAKRKDEGSNKKSMAEILSGFADVDSSFEKEVILQNKVVDLDIDAIRVEISHKPDLAQAFADDLSENDELFPEDAVQVCGRKFNINQSKSSILKYI